MKFLKNSLIISLSLMLIAGCTKIEESQLGQADNQAEFPDQESWNSTIIITQDARKVAEVWAGYIAVYNEKNIAVLKDSIHIDFFDKNGLHNSVLTADSGVVYNETNDLEAIGNVQVFSDSGIVLETERLNWDNNRQKIVSHVPVRFTTKEDTLIGDSFISDPDLKNYEIRNARGYSRRKIPTK
ncbi:MAG: LPS export ABC transporter periplasmic protein LptC [Calditrichia bacterium]